LATIKISLISLFSVEQHSNAAKVKNFLVEQHPDAIKVKNFLVEQHSDAAELEIGDIDIFYKGDLNGKTS
jgi:hypothetical protein